jgi:hypothetical protein
MRAHFNTASAPSPTTSTPSDLLLTIDTLILGGGLTATYELPWRMVDFRLWLAGESQYWRQEGELALGALF